MSPTRCWCGKELTEDQLRRGNRNCSRKHGSHFQRARGTSIEVRRSWIAKANAARAQQFKDRVLASILADFNAVTNADGLVELREAVKVVVKHRRISYQRGWAANYARRMRAIA